jgi:hypothetical protein
MFLEAKGCRDWLLSFWKAIRTSAPAFAGHILLIRRYRHRETSASFPKRALDAGQSYCASGLQPA